MKLKRSFILLNGQKQKKIFKRKKEKKKSNYKSMLIRINSLRAFGIIEIKRDGLV